MSTKLYNVHFYHVCPKTGHDTGGYNHGKKVNSSPMPHHSACVFMSKHIQRQGTAYRLVEHTREAQHNGH